MSIQQSTTSALTGLDGVVKDLVLNGDISKLSPMDKVKYYNGLCNSLGLNPLTQPFQVIIFQGKETLYAKKDCTEQLRKIYGVSITSLTSQVIQDICIVTVNVKDKNGREDAATGAVNIKGLAGDNLANAFMKAETKAKRRATLSICGLGMLDESETETIGKFETVEIPVKALDPNKIEYFKNTINLCHAHDLINLAKKLAVENPDHIDYIRQLTKDRKESLLKQKEAEEAGVCLAPNDYEPSSYENIRGGEDIPQ